MAKINRLIPFGWLPGHWGLSGETRKRAKIEYEYDGYDREIRLVDLHPESPDIKKKRLNIEYEYENIDEYEYQQSMIDIEIPDDVDKNKLAKLALDYDQGKIPKDSYNLKCAEIEHGTDSVEYKIANLTLKLNEGDLTELEYEKKVANVMEEPWIRVSSSSYDPEDGIDGFSFELDYNKFFVQYLKEHGYTGISDDEVVEEWFNDVSKSELATEIEADMSIPKTTISKEDVKTESGKPVRRFS